MGEHHFNPVAKAHAEGKQMVRALDLGEGCALIGSQIVPTIVGEELVFQLFAIGGKESPIMGFQPKPVAICEIARASLAGVRLAFAGGAQGPTASASEPATESAAPDASPILQAVP